MKFITPIYIFLFLTAFYAQAQIPTLNSNPASTGKVIYLDFDGQKVVGTMWNGGAVINAQPSSATPAAIRQIWNRVSEDYRPFDVNVTTDSVRFNNAMPNRRIRVVFTPTSAWYGSAGGVAYVSSFAWGGNPGTPCWVFENQLGYNPKSMAEAAAHECGHTMSLRHQSTYNSSCVKTNEYHPGQGSGVTSWAPIMGVGYNRNVTVWFNGRSATACNTFQNDHGNASIGLTNMNYLSFLPDDIGDTYPTAKIVNLNSQVLLDSGLITEPSDLDAWKFDICDTRYITFNIKPWALDTINYSGANLDIRLHVYDNNNNLLALDTTLSRLHGIIGLNLNPGSYYFTVDGGRSNNYSDYGSLGKYYVRISATNPPALTNTIVLPTSVCAGQTLTLNSSSNGVPLNWQWTVTNAANSIVYNSASPSFVPAGGIYTISLLSSNNSATSCPVTLTLNAGNLPALNISANSTVVCPGRSATLTASGAQSYTWIPGGFSGNTQFVSPAVNTTYSVTGSNGNCINSAAISVSVVPNFSLSTSVSQSLICYGQSVTINASGTNGYTINPGNINTVPAVVSPTFNTNYTILGSIGPCIQVSQRFVGVVADFSVAIVSSDSIVCSGSPVILSGTGAGSFTFNPGNLSGVSVTVNPQTSTVYTVSGANNPLCVKQASIMVTTLDCNTTGLNTLNKEKSLSVYPNPVTSVLSVYAPASSEIVIYNSLGSLVYKGRSNEQAVHTIQLESWPRGLYFVSIAGSETVTKVILE